MKKIFILLILSCMSFFAFSQKNDSEKGNEKIELDVVQTFNIIYISDADYLTNMASEGLDDNLLYEYFKKGSALFSLFHSVEEAMSGMRGFRDRNLVTTNKIQTIYVLSDYCCANNGNMPSSIKLHSNNEITSYR